MIANPVGKFRDITVILDKDYDVLTAERLLRFRSLGNTILQTHVEALFSQTLNRWA